MDITRMSDTELAVEIRGRCITNMAADDLVKFIRQCVKDSVPEELSKEKLALCVSEATSWFPETPNVLKSVCIETLAEAIHTALYGNTKPDERNRKNNHVA